MFVLRNAVAFMVLAFGFPNNGVAQQVSLLQASFFHSGSQPMIQAQPSEGDIVRHASSLFIDQQGSSLLAPYPMRQRRVVHLAVPLQVARVGSQIERVRALIGQAESGAKSYDAIQHGAKILPAKSPTQMSIQEIYDWIAETPGQHHAIGRYQFIPATLKRLVAKNGASPYQLFTPQLQDQLSDILLVEAGLNAFGRGDMERHTFMNNMAKIWAGLPNSSGKSHYDGVAGNRATMTWAYFDREMGRIFPS